MKVFCSPRRLSWCQWITPLLPTKSHPRFGTCRLTKGNDRLCVSNWPGLASGPAPVFPANMTQILGIRLFERAISTNRIPKIWVILAGNASFFPGRENTSYSRITRLIHLLIGGHHTLLCRAHHSKHGTLIQCCVNVGLPSTTLVQH